MRTQPKIVGAMDRRCMLTALTALAGTIGFATPSWSREAMKPRLRVIVDNDFSGDPDGLFQLAHHLLSPSVIIPFIIGSHIHENDFLDGSETQADNAAQRARDLIAVMELPSPPPVLAGRNRAPAKGAAPHATALTKRIIAEAMRKDTDLPLVYAAGAGLTELAEAIRIEPKVASRIRLVWIGGMEWAEYADGAPLKAHPEYNMTIDLAATQTIFNESEVEVWQVPRNVYRQLMISMPELSMRLGESGPVGPFLLDALDRVRLGYDDRMGDTYILGDNPLVTLTALLSSFEPDTSSSEYFTVAKPLIMDDCSYRQRKDAPPMRIYRTIDTRLTLADMFARLAEAGRTNRR